MKKFAKIMLISMVTWLMMGGLAEACPMCRVALEDAMHTDQRPTAYMVSILFMLTIPFMIFGSIGGVLFYVSKHEQALADGLTAEAMKRS